ncbi:MAG: hypothetical protein ACXW4E_03230 [Anaerolineales bacterium]
MFKNRFIVVLGVLSLLLVTMAVSQPFSNAPASAAAGANDFYERHPNWNRNLEASDYYERHSELSGSVASIDEEFALRHPAWTVSVQNATIPVTGPSEALDYFQRHPVSGLPAESAADLSDYSARHPELRTPAISELSDYFLRH